MKIGSHRTTVQLNPQLTKNLVAYAAEAGAGLLSRAQAAEARVVYTPANISNRCKLHFVSRSQQ